MRRGPSAKKGGAELVRSIDFRVRAHAGVAHVSRGALPLFDSHSCPLPHDLCVCTASSPSLPAASFAAARAAEIADVGGCMAVPVLWRPAGEFIVESIALLYY